MSLQPLNTFSLRKNEVKQKSEEIEYLVLSNWAVNKKESPLYPFLRRGIRRAQVLSSWGSISANNRKAPPTKRPSLQKTGKEVPCSLYRITLHRIQGDLLTFPEPTNDAGVTHIYLYPSYVASSSPFFLPYCKAPRLIPFIFQCLLIRGTRGVCPDDATSSSRPDPPCDCIPDGGEKKRMFFSSETNVSIYVNLLIFFYL